MFVGNVDAGLCGGDREKYKVPQIQPLSVEAQSKIPVSAARPLPGPASVDAGLCKGDREKYKAPQIQPAPVEVQSKTPVPASRPLPSPSSLEKSPLTLLRKPMVPLIELGSHVEKHIHKYESLSGNLTPVKLTGNVAKHIAAIENKTNKI